MTEPMKLVAEQIGALVISNAHQAAQIAALETEIAKLKQIIEDLESSAKRSE